MSHEIAIYHDIITPYVQPMLYSSHAYSFICFSFWLMRLTNPAPVTSVLTNQMQYQPHGSPLSHFTWSGVDAGVLGHVRRFDENL